MANAQQQQILEINKAEVVDNGSGVGEYRYSLTRFVSENQMNNIRRWMKLGRQFSFVKEQWASVHCNDTGTEVTVRAKTKDNVKHAWVIVVRKTTPSAEPTSI